MTVSEPTCLRADYNSHKIKQLYAVLSGRTIQGVFPSHRASTYTLAAVGVLGWDFVEALCDIG
jgi:hypothetical protein